MHVIVEVPYDDYSEGVRCFRSSLGYTYLSGRFPAQALIRLELILTLSGVDPWAWERLAMSRLFARQTPKALASALSRSPLDIRTIHRAVRAIRRSARAIHAPYGVPPHSAPHLEQYGVPAQTYQQVLAAAFNPMSTVVLDESWVDSQLASMALVQRPHVLQPAFAMMGLTARAIEQMIESGGAHGDRQHDEEQG